MKKNVLENIESIKEKRALSKEVQKKIADRIISNWAICIAILILIITFTIAANMLTKTITQFIYNVCSVVILIFALVILEIAYKKDSGDWAISGIEILALAIFTLFSPYIFLKFTNQFIYCVICIITIYYIIKIIRIYLKENKLYLIQTSDISNIIKKESKDELAQEFEEKRQEEIKKQSVPKKETKTKGAKKTGTKNSNKKTTTKVTTKKAEPKKTTANKTTSSKTATAKSTAKKPTTKKATTAKTTAKKTATKKTTTTKTTANKKNTTKKNTQSKPKIAEENE